METTIAACLLLIRVFFPELGANSAQVGALAGPNASDQPLRFTKLLHFSTGGQPPVYTTMMERHVERLFDFSLP